MESKLREQIIEALEEAKIMECAHDVYDEDHVLHVATRLSGAPLSSVKKIHSEKKKVVDIEWV